MDRRPGHGGGGLTADRLCHLVGEYGKVQGLSPHVGIRTPTVYDGNRADQQGEVTGLLSGLLSGLLRVRARHEMIHFSQ